jgi:hypothetical protein
LPDSEWDQETRYKWENSKFQVLNPKPKWKIAGINTLFRIIILSKIRLNLSPCKGERLEREIRVGFYK